MIIFIFYFQLQPIVFHFNDSTVPTERGYRNVDPEKIKFIENIKGGLVEAALSTEAWIITSGLDNVCVFENIISIITQLYVHDSQPVI